MRIRSFTFTAALATLVALAALVGCGSRGRVVHELDARVRALGATELAPVDGVEVAQAPNPADDAGKHARSGDGDRADVRQSRLRSWEYPAIEVEAEHTSDLREEDRIGSYGQPRWTAHRRFPAVRVYVRPEGELDVEFWCITKAPRHGPAQVITQTEFEIGLPHRLQLDLYAITRREGTKGETFVDQAVELRWALADWDEIFGNPTFYAEYVSKDSESDVFELKALFGGELSSGWHWGVNCVWEQQIEDAEETELELTTGVGCTVVDETLSLGVETKCAIANEKGARDDWTENVRVGPSLQWRPLPQMHIDFAPLFGVTHDSRLMDAFLVVGWEF